MTDHNDISLDLKILKFHHVYLFIYHEVLYFLTFHIIFTIVICNL